MGLTASPATHERALAGAERALASRRPRWRERHPTRCTLGWRATIGNDGPERLLHRVRHCIAMLCDVVPPVGQLKVLDPVIGLGSVYVMHDLGARERPSDELRHDEPMFCYVPLGIGHRMSVAYPQNDVSVPLEPSAAPGVRESAHSPDLVLAGHSAFPIFLTCHALECTSEVCH